MAPGWLFSAAVQKYGHKQIICEPVAFKVFCRVDSDAGCIEHCSVNKMTDSYLRVTRAEVLAYDPGQLSQCAQLMISHIYMIQHAVKPLRSLKLYLSTQGEDIPGKGSAWPCPWEFHSPGGIGLGRGPTGLGGLRLLGSAAMLLRSCLKSFLLPKPPTADSHVGK